MAFFNYSTMQMTAKIVYYGPGLGGKTTNLQFIYGHTTDASRGEMVSLETQTDRTLFFDLLPMEVGTVAGFRTKIQLYTVPGQVFYNTTRKLVLKGVDGVVFVADSQPPMMQANIESLKNLEENLTELGLSIESMPLVLQYNKRDLPDVLSVQELDDALNSRQWSCYEASALTGEGVFETLRGVSRLTLISLRKQLEVTPRRKKAAPSIRDAPPDGPPSPQRPSVALEPPPLRLRRDFLLRVPEHEFHRTQRLVMNLDLEDGDEQIVRRARSIEFEIQQGAELSEILLQLNLALRSED